MIETEKTKVEEIKPENNSEEIPKKLWAPKKYTEEWVLNELLKLLDELKSHKEYIYIWELFEDKDYTRSRYNEWLTKPKEDHTSRYWNNEDIVNISATIKEILETRAVKWLMKNELNATWTIFHLKNNYKWVDKHEVDNNHSWELSIWWILDTLWDKEVDLTKK